MLGNLFSKKEYVFLLHRDSLWGMDSQEKILHNQVLKYVGKQLKGLFLPRRIKYIDYYAQNGNEDAWSIMTTFDPKDKRKFLPLIYEMYAFTKTREEKIFNDYKVEKAEFSDIRQKMTVYKITL